MKKILIYLLLLAGIMAPGTASCDDARIDDVIVTRNPALKVSFLVKDAFTKEIEEAVKSGIPTVFAFHIELNRLNSIWLNDGAGRWEFKHRVKYDTLRDEYEVTLDETGEKGIRTKDMNEMKKLMATCNAISLMTARPLSRGDEYEIRIMSELHSTEMPILLNYMFFFLRLWDFKTGWYYYRFTP